MLSQRKTFAGCWSPHLRSLAGENPGKHGKIHVSPLFNLNFGATIIRNILTRRCFISLNGLNGQIELLSFATVPYDYYDPINYVDVASGSLDLGRHRTKHSVFYERSSILDQIEANIYFICFR